MNTVSVVLVALLAAAPALVGCRPDNTFRCELDQQCRRGNRIGFCESAGYCSFVDGDCPSAHRYDDTAGDELAGQCVPTGGDVADAMVAPDGELWPCGTKPAAPPATVAHDEVQGANHLTLSLSNTKVNGGTVVEVAPGATLMISTSFSLVDCICPTCIDQIEIGLVPGPRMACVYDANPNLDDACGPPTPGTDMLMRPAPMTPGLYELRFRIGQDFACMNHPSWWENIAPTADTTVAYVCVR